MPIKQLNIDAELKNNVQRGKGSGVHKGPLMDIHNKDAGKINIKTSQYCC